MEARITAAEFAFSQFMGKKEQLAELAYEAAKEDLLAV